VTEDRRLPRDLTDEEMDTLTVVVAATRSTWVPRRIDFLGALDQDVVLSLTCADCGAPGLVQLRIHEAGLRQLRGHRCGRPD